MPFKVQPPHYARWLNMRARCYNKNCKDYKNYGARGIRVCKEWRNNYKSFEKWCFKHYHKGLVLDRIDNNGNYSPENCRFVSYLINTKNRRFTKAMKLQIKKLHIGLEKYKLKCGLAVVEAGVRRCRVCLIEKPFSDLARDKNSYAGVKKLCKTCHVKQVQEYQTKNRRNNEKGINNTRNSKTRTNRSAS